MEKSNKVFATICLVAEVLFLAFALYQIGESAMLATRMRGNIPYTLIIAAIALGAPGVLLVRGYREFTNGDAKGKERILVASAIAATTFGLTFVPGVDSLVFGLGSIPTNHNLMLRLFNLTFGPGGAKYIYVISLVIQAILPILLLAACERRSFMKVTGPVIRSGLINIVGSVLVVWAAFAATAGLAASRTFDHSWLIVGFVPIPGQILLVFPIVLALAGIVVIWTRPWK